MTSNREDNVRQLFEAPEFDVDDAPAELVGRVARAIAAAQYPGGESLPEDWTAARAAIAVVFEWARQP